MAGVGSETTPLLASQMKPPAWGSPVGTHVGCLFIVVDVVNVPCKAKVCYLHHIVLCHQDIPGGQVSVYALRTEEGRVGSGEVRELEGSVGGAATHANWPTCVIGLLPHCSAPEPLLSLLECSLPALGFSSQQALLPSLPKCWPLMPLLGLQGCVLLGPASQHYKSTCGWAQTKPALTHQTLHSTLTDSFILSS